MIEVKNLSKSFGDKCILKNINTIFESGKCNLIIGASGSGKTVLSKCILGLFPINEGEVFFKGQLFSSMNKASVQLLRQQTGVLFQGSALFDSSTIEENIAFPIKMFTRKTKKEIIYKVNETLERVGLTGTNKLYPAEVSGGMKKRVAIARAIVLNPHYLFCDEPNSGLDPLTSIKMDKLIKELTVEYQTTTIVVTHDMNSTMEIGDNIIFIHQTEIEWRGSNQDIIYSNNQILNQFIFSSNYLQEYKRIKSSSIT